MRIKSRLDDYLRGHAPTKQWSAVNKYLFPRGAFTKVPAQHSINAVLNSKYILSNS